MRAVTVGISRLEDSLERFKQVMETGDALGKFISFESPELLFKRLTPKRWELLHRLQEGGAMSVRELARRLERDVKNVHGDVRALMEIGLVEKDGEKICVPFDEIRTSFVLKKAA